MNQKDIETEKISRPLPKQELKGLELQLLRGGFMPEEVNVDRLVMYRRYFEHLYNVTPLIDKQNKIMYKCMYEVLTEQISRYGDNK